MKRKVLSILIAAAMTTSMTVSSFAVSAADGTESTESYINMSTSDKEAFINDNLDIKMQHLSTLVTLSSNRAYEEIAGEVKAALDDGLTAVEIKEAIYHSGAYCGYTRAAGALDAADAVLKELGEDGNGGNQHSERERSKSDEPYEYDR